MSETDRLLWLELPETVETDMGAFVLDPAIPLPVEANEHGSLDVETLEWEQIVAAILLVLADSPTHPHADYYRQLAQVLRPDLHANLQQGARRTMEDGQWDQAEDILLAWNGLYPQDAEARLAMARYYDQRSRYERRIGRISEAETLEQAAERAYTQILSADDARPEAWYHAGMFRYRHGAFQKAARTLETFLQIATEQGHAAEERPQQEARRILRFCQDGHMASDLYQGAYAALASGDIETGMQRARQFRDRHPELWPGWFLLGWGHRLQEEYKMAQEALSHAQERGCQEAELYNELAICARALNDFDAAAQALEAALQRDPYNITILSNMALVQQKKGQLQEARRWAETALTLAPNDEIARTLVQQLKSDEQD